MALNPRFAQFGLTDADADLVNSFVYAARRAGWTNDRVEQAFGWFKEFGHVQMTADARLQSFRDYAAERGWQTGQIDTALNWFGAAAEAIDAGRPPDLPPLPTREQDAGRLAELERVMRTEPTRYWRDVALQDELYEINLRAGGEVTAAPSSPLAVASAPSPASSRRAEIEAMMGTADYWKNPGIQAEYRSLLSGVPEPAGGASLGPEASPAGVGSVSGVN